MSHQLLTGLLLRHFPVREADEFLTLWSFEEGKVRALARAVRKPQSKLKAALAPAAWLQLQVVARAGHYVVVEARVSKSYPGILQNLSHLALVFNLFELVMHATVDGESNPKISMLLRESLEYLDRTPAAGLDFLNDFQLRFLSALGYGFERAVCRHCGTRLLKTGQASWSSAFLGLVCANCAKYDSMALSVPPETVEYLLNPPAFLVNHKERAASFQSRLKIHHMLSEILDNIVERRLQSRQFLAQQPDFNQVLDFQ